MGGGSSNGGWRKWLASQKVLRTLNMDFVPIPAPVAPNALPLGYSSLEDAPRFFQEVDRNGLASDGIVVDATRHILIQRVLKGKPGRRSSTFVWHRMVIICQTATGRLSINKAANVHPRAIYVARHP